MTIPTTLEELTALFQQLGAKQPESWAKSQLDEGIPQLHRFLFLRQAWRNVLTQDSVNAWIAGHIASSTKNPGAPFSGVGPALERLQAGRTPASDIAEVVRGAQVEFLFQLCYMLEDPAIEEPEAEEVAWGLFEVDEEGNPGEPILGLHESVLQMDPTGREMRP